ncbi:hypothetical protein LOD99_13546, partial [Oopsacas minuta]
MISQQGDTSSLPRYDLYECYMCGDKFDSELAKDNHMGTCMVADGPNSLDSSLDPVRALHRQSVNRANLDNTSPPHQLTRNISHPPKNDFSAPVGSTRMDVAIPPYIPEDYSQALEGEMFRQIHFPPKQKPTPAGRDLVSSSNHQIAPYVQEGPRNKLFQTNAVRSSCPPPPPPSEPGQLPFKQNHTPITRHASDSRFRDIEIRSPPSYTVDTNSPTNPLIQPKLVPRTNFRESHQPEVELIQQHHEVPYTRSQPRDNTKGDKFEVKLLWQKQQPTLERNLEYLDMKDTEHPITLRWEYRKELFIASAKLSAGEHRGSLVIPDSDAVVYEVQPFTVSQFSISVQEIKLELSDIAPQYKKKEPLKKPIYSEIDLASKHLANLRRGEHPPYLPERRATLSGTDNPVIPVTRQEDRSRVEVNVLSPTIEYSPIQSIERPDIPPKYREEIPKYQLEANPQTVKPFKIVREERRATISGQSPPVFKSTLPRHEERVSVVLNSPPQDHPLPPPRIKPSVTTEITEKSREELEQKRQIDALILNLKTELANVKTEREEI